MLDEELESYGRSEAYPFHMPGHKRRNMGIGDPYAVDITEIHGFDNLHDSRGPIREAMEHLTKLYGSRQSYLLVNGSTCGNLTAVFAAVDLGEELIIGRNCHKSVYHGAYLRRNRLHYLYPEEQPGEGGFSLPGQIRPEAVKKALEQYPGSKAVIITSPTYEGIVSDIAGIAEVCHERGVPLIVDAAHGAHLGFHPYFPPSPVAQQADLVIMSLHKTLPSFTQTAVLHFQSDLLSKEKCERYLRIFQSSSPSYLLMDGMVKCVRYLEEEGQQAYEAYVRLLENFYAGTKELRHLSVLRMAYQDPSKIVISTRGTGLTGEMLSRRLRERFALELEMSSFDYALAMTSIMDTREGMDRLRDALFALDREIGQRQTPETGQTSGIALAESMCHGAEKRGASYGGRQQVLELWEAMDAPSRDCPLDQAVGQIAAEEISIYPPGIPVLVPGERIAEEDVEQVKKALETRLDVQGICRREEKIYLPVVDAAPEEKG